eukprot:CAMPEP_0201639016 /NCGR_PEP_ID=MMETSP0493-20130528/18183_1 /ASSEMBLY_ACC=CAM_ASM_000838 /TAXON_ID=420259 /ORGANISM="Thalassiosira gravida, Strain GMp14c1" /LENGTH=62 /DNA_ID=CAMNT_0048112263 /DNA_START=152 /DNA_END=337 /DNA_ORIENTATION=-
MVPNTLYTLIAKGPLCAALAGEILNDGLSEGFDEGLPSTAGVGTGTLVLVLFVFVDDRPSGR